MNGKALIATLENIKSGETYDIFNLMPEIAGGKAWVREIKDAANAMIDRLNVDEDYDITDLKDLGIEYANNAVELSYEDIHNLNHELRLWASNDLDHEVGEISSETNSDCLTNLEQLYLYCAMQVTWDAVADQAYENTEEDGE